MRASRGMGIINPKKMKAGGKVFKSHMMYDKKTGKAVKAPTMAKHLELKKKGYGCVNKRHTSVLFG